MIPNARFMGFRRQDGRFGVRNHVLVLSTTGLTGRIAQRVHGLVAGTICLGTSFGRGQVGADAELHAATLGGLIRNPNVAATVVMSADRGLSERYAAIAESVAKPHVCLALPDFHEDNLAMSFEGARAATRLVRDASRLRREPAPVSALSMAVECGHSDATSGILANPLVGEMARRIVGEGGQVIFSETLEWTGAEHVLAGRARTTEIAEAIRNAVSAREARAAAEGADVRAHNPGPQNIAGGLTTLEEKALGAIAKGGHQQIDGLLKACEAPVGPGLFLMDTPYFSPESVTAMVAGGCQIVVFTTGPGNSYCSAVAPTIKVSANPDTCAILHEQIDLAIPGRTVEARSRQAVDSSLEYLLSVASGELTLGEITGEGDEAISRLGPSL